MPRERGKKEKLDKSPTTSLYVSDPSFSVPGLRVAGSVEAANHEMISQQPIAGWRTCLTDYGALYLPIIVQAFLGENVQGGERVVQNHLDATAWLA